MTEPFRTGFESIGLELGWSSLFRRDEGSSPLRLLPKHIFDFQCCSETITVDPLRDFLFLLFERGLLVTSITGCANRISIVGPSANYY